jgi:arylsulfatase A-like enzyme
MAAMRGVDRGLGQLVHTLRQAGEERDTVIVFVADNGTFYGEHRIFKGKGDPYEEGIHVPMLMRVPGQVLGRPPATTVPEPVANIDLAPTMLDLASVRPCTTGGQCREPDGRSIVPLLRGGSSPAARDRAVLLQVGPGCNGYDGVRTARYTYVEYRGTPTAGGGCTVESRELFDLHRDPYELRNVLASPATARRYGAVRRDLNARLDRLVDCQGSSGRDACE